MMVAETKGHNTGKKYGLILVIQEKTSQLIFFDSERDDLQFEDVSEN